MINHWIGKIFGRAIGCPGHEELFDFALDGVESSQQDRVRRHLADCPPCREQVKDYAWVSEGIALNAPQVEPPPGLCDKVKARIREEALSPQAPAPARALRDPLAGWPRFWMRLGPVFALSSLMMTILAFVAVMNRPAPANPDLQATAEILGSPSMKLVSLNGAGEAKAGRGSLFLAPGMDRMLVKVEGLKPCAAGADYALWASPRGGKPVRLGSFKAVEGRCAYVLSLPRPFELGPGPLDFEVTHEDGGAAPEKGPAHLRGRYNL
jgi:hypothetical protein